MSMSRKGDRMDAVRVQLKSEYTCRRACMRAVSDHMINDTTARPSHTSGYVDYAMWLRHTDISGTGVKEREGR
jgi:hypothetical protein